MKLAVVLFLALQAPVAYPNWTSRDVLTATVTLGSWCMPCNVRAESVVMSLVHTGATVPSLPPTVAAQKSVSVVLTPAFLAMAEQISISEYSQKLPCVSVHCMSYG